MGISIWQLLIVLVIVVLLFGTRRLKGMGSDLGGAIKGFRTALKDGEEDAEPDQNKGSTIEGQVGSEKQQGK